MIMLRVMMKSSVRAGGCTVPCRDSPAAHPAWALWAGCGLGLSRTLFSRAHIGLNGNDCDHSDFFDFCTVMQSKLNITSQSLLLLYYYYYYFYFYYFYCCYCYYYFYTQLLDDKWVKYCAIHVITAGMCWRL